LSEGEGGEGNQRGEQEGHDSDGAKSHTAVSTFFSWLEAEKLKPGDDSSCIIWDCRATSTRLNSKGRRSTDLNALIFSIVPESKGKLNFANGEQNPTNR
jgi:hypothetical protein